MSTNNSKTKSRGESVQNIHDIFKKSWELLSDIKTPAFEEEIENKHSKLFDVSNLIKFDEKHAMNKAIQHAAYKWEKLDLRYGLNRRRIVGKKDFRFTKLPENFDLWAQHLNTPELYEKAIISQIQFENSEKKKNSEISDEDEGSDEMISSMDEAQYTQELYEIFSMIPSYRDIDSNHSSSSSTSSLSSTNKLCVERMKEHIDALRLTTICSDKNPISSLIYPFSSEQAILEIQIFSQKRIKNHQYYKALKSHRESSSSSSSSSSQPDLHAETVEKQISSLIQVTPEKIQTLLVCGSTLLSDFVQQIRCPCENLYKGFHQTQQSVYSPAIALCIGETVYGNSAYVSSVRDDDIHRFPSFVESRKRNRSSSSSSSSSDSKFEAIENICFTHLEEIKLNEPCLYYHHNDCLHQFTITDIRLPSPQGSQCTPSSSSSLPVQTFIKLEQNKACQGCKISKAAYVTYHDTLKEETSVPSPMYFCDACHFSLHYTAQGDLLDEYKDNDKFRIFPYIVNGF